MRELRYGLAALALVAGLTAGKASAQAVIKIGEVNSYKVVPAFLEPYRKGWELAVEEINAAGGVLGSKLEVLSRDDNGNPGDAVRVAEELLTRDQVSMIGGGYLSNIGLALGDFAKQRKIVYLASEPLSDQLVWEKGNRYTYRLRTSTYMQSAMLVVEAAKLPAKRWAVVAPNYEYGQSAVRAFKELLKAARPDVEFVGEQFPPLGRIDAGPVAEALADAKPDAIFNVLFGPDLQKFVREGNTRNLFKNRSVASLLTGEPEYLDTLKDETPPGWVVTGYPQAEIDTPEHKKFREAYQAKWKDYPRLGSVVGYAMIQSIAEAIKKAGGTDAEKLQAAFQDLTLTIPFGRITYRAIDHQSTMGAYVGKTALKDGRGVMTDWYFADGAKFLPSDDMVRKLRPAD
jgi:branched-chain amino acid transport system substrate-binding protein